MLRIVLLFLLLPAASTVAQQHPTIAFRIPEKDLIPEGIAHDPAEDAFYLGSINKSKILKITRGGKISEFVATGDAGLKQVLGMKVLNGKLWACNNTPSYDSVNRDSFIHVVDTKTGKVEKVFPLSDGQKHLFNDLVFTKNGDAYITDSEGGAIYKIRKDGDAVEEFVPVQTLQYPNGIIVSSDDTKILVSVGTSQGVISIDLATKEIKPVQHEKFMFFGIDGFYRYKDSWIGVQNVLFPESIVKINPGKNEMSIEKLELLVANHELFDSPTTGVIVKDEFYFIANSQLMQIIGNRGVIKNPKELNETFILKIKLN
jgi:hypothetical protein